MELQLIARLSAAVSDLADLDLDAVSDQSLLELARRVRQVACRLQSVEIEVVGAIDGRGAAITEGLRSTATWLRSQLRVSDSAARVRCARAVSAMPAVGEAFSAGEISLEHLRAIVRVARDLDGEGYVGAAEQMLVDEARTSTPARLAQAGARIRDQLAPDRSSAHVGRPDAKAPRWLNVRRTVDGAVAISGRFDRETGDDVIETVEALAGLTGKDDVRPAALRRADALLTLCRQAATYATTASSHAYMKNHAPGDRAMTGTRGVADGGRDKALRPAGRRRLKGRVKRRARR